MAIKLLPFQEKNVRRIQKFDGRCVVSDEMGLGKTVQAIAWWQANKHRASPAVVVCPATGKFHWQDEFALHANTRCDILEGRKPRRRIPIVCPKVIIVNYDILQYWVKYLRRLNPQLIIIDEAQRFRAPDRQLGRQETQYNATVKAGFRLCRNVPHVIALGGTGGMENCPAEMFAVLHMIRPDKFRSYFEYVTEFCDPQSKPWGWEYKGSTNLDVLHKRLKKYCMVRNRKEDVLDLPPRNRIVIPMRDVSLREYIELERDLKRWLIKRGYHRKRIRGADRAEAMTKCGYLMRTASKLKIKSIIQWVEDFLKEKNEKIILFGLHKFFIKALRDHFGKRSVVVDGSTPLARRKSAIRSFNADPAIRVFIGQIKAAGVLWSAKDCRTTATCEYWWNPATHTQADDRVHGMYRGKSNLPVFNYYFTTRGTIEERICRLLQIKQGNIDAVLDGKKVTKFDLFDQLMKELTTT